MGISGRGWGMRETGSTGRGERAFGHGWVCPLHKHKSVALLRTHRILENLTATDSSEPGHLRRPALAGGRYRCAIKRCRHYSALCAQPEESIFSAL